MAIDKSKLTGVEKVYPLHVSPYEQYMGDFQNPSVVSKVNAMIQSLHQIGRLTNETVSQWNNVMKWIVDGGMDEIAETITNEKVSVALNEVMRMLDVSLDNGLKELAENVSDKKIDELLASGQFESMIQTSLVEINEVVENKLDGFNLQLADIATNASVFGVVGDGIADDTEKLSILLNSKSESIIFPKNKIYRITKEIRVTTGKPKKVDFNGSTILTDFTSNSHLFHFGLNVELHNLVIDLNSKWLRVGLNYPMNLGVIKTRNITIKNLMDKEIQPTYLMLISGIGNTLDIEGTTFKNIKKQGDGSETISLTGINIHEGAMNGGSIRRTKIDGFQRVNSDGNVIRDISNAIYIASGDTDLDVKKLMIDGINAYNFGKRLIKSQVSNLVVKNVYAESQDGSAMTGISFQDRDAIRTKNCSADNVTLKGKMSNGFAVSSDNCKLSNIDISIETAELSGPTAYGIAIAGDNLHASKVNIKAPIAITGNRSPSLNRGSVKNVSITDGEIHHPLDGFALQWEYGSVEPFEGFFLQNIKIYAKYSSTGSQSIKVGNQTVISKNLTLNNIDVICDHNTVNVGEILRAIYVDGIVLKGLTVKNPKGGSLYRVLSILNSANHDIQNLYTKEVKVDNAIVSSTNNKNINVDNLSSNINSLYDVSLTATDAILGRVNRNKIAFNDLESRQTSKFIKSFSVGTTAQRPLIHFMGDEYYDSTLKKPIYSDGTIWKDSVGTTV